ncbi:LysR family transcriptional regulator [Ideonella sp. 4Y16]|uniref:LysR family transcriptional regulator n=1 Tax=Ideonella alba TaxID=2824118 RepID=UPI001B368934|nr:LysR family transcriptional regulator [Ideonella alba]MBQ0942855.1 LysR family transcriptional regulator [Ideonella alba]
MALTHLSLNHLHAFAAASRHLNFTRAADELCVTQAAVSHQIKALEAQIGQRLFLRTARGLQLSDEGARLAPLVQQAFALLDKAVQLLDERSPPERLTVAVVGTYAQGWLLERLPQFQAEHPHIELRLQTHNNKLDLATETIDAAIRFGDGAWRSTHAVPLQAAPLTPLCAPALAATLARPADLRRCTLLRSYRTEDWPAWSRAAGLEPLNARGPQFDSSVLMVQAALLGSGVALAPAAMFPRELAEGRLVQPFGVAVDVGRYWLTRPLGREPSAALRAFEAWLQAEAVRDGAQPPALS